MSKESGFGYTEMTPEQKRHARVRDFLEKECPSVKPVLKKSNRKGSSGEVGNVFPLPEDGFHLNKDSKTRSRIFHINGK
jgi:hypothetical protein